MQLSRIASLAAALGAATALAQPAHAQPVCQSVFVWREAFSGDTICVSVQRRDDVAKENAQAAARRNPAGGEWGPNTCRQGFVWRVATPKDLVCVTPDSRDLVARENANPHAHVAAATPAPAPASQSSEWSKWIRAEDADFRYRFDFDPKKQGDLMVFVEVKNRISGVWQGAARGVDCRSDVLGRGEQQISLNPRETKTVKFVTANCGSAAKPFLKEPSVVRSKSL